MDLLEQGSAWLEAQRTRFATRPVTYRRGVNLVEVLATVGRTEFQIDNGYGLVERIESRDYLIATADLVLGGTPVLPERGDQVRETVGGQAFVYEVLAPGKEPAWRYSDPYRRTLRIHTKHVATEVAA